VKGEADTAVFAVLDRHVVVLEIVPRGSTDAMLHFDRMLDRLALR
jgi:hypothetical protein